MIDGYLWEVLVPGVRTSSKEGLLWNLCAS